MKFRYAVTLLILLFASTSQSKSQVLISLIFGDKINSEKNYFGIHFNQSLNRIRDFEETKSLSTFNIGLFFSHRFNEKWMLNVEALAKYRRGAESLAPYSLGSPELNETFAGAEINRQINYLGLPVSMRYFLGQKFFVEGGPQLNMRLKAQDLFMVEMDSDEAIYKKDVRDQVARWDFNLLFGSGFLLGKDRSKTLGLRHIIGLSDVLPDLSSSQNHSQWAVFLNFPIGRGKMKEEK